MSRESPNTERESGAGQRRLGDHTTGGGDVPDAAYRQLHEAIAGDGDPTERRRALLSVVQKALDADTAFLARVDPDRGRWRVLESVGPRDVVPAGEETDLAAALCRHTVAEGEFALADARTAPGEPAYWRFGLGSYLGARVAVEGQTVGTLAVADAGPSDERTDDERALVTAGADLVAAEPAMVDATDSTGPTTSGARPLSVPASWFDGGMLTVSADRRVTRVDDAAASILERSPRAVVSESLSAALGEDDRADLAVREALATGDAVAFECRNGDALLWVGVYPNGDGVNVYLREATERREHEQVLERVTDGFLSLDERLSFTYVNSHAGEFLGQARESLEGASVDAMAETGTETDEAVERALPRAVRQARARDETVGFEARTPESRWVHGRAYPDDDGVSVYLHDVTERRRREQLLDGLLSHTRDLMAVESRRAVADVVTAAVEDAVGFRRAQVFLHDDHDLLVPAGSLDDPSALSAGPVHEPGEGPVGRAFSDDEPQMFEDLASDDAPDVGPGAENGDTLLAVPLGEHGAVTVRAGPGATVGEDDVSLVSLIAETAVAALNRARRSERLSTYEEVLDVSRDQVYAIDDGGQLTFVSPALADRLGYDPDRLVGEHLTTVLSAPGSRAVADAVRRLPRSDENDIAVETEAIAADDERVPVEVAVSVIPGGDGPTGAVGVVREIEDLEAVREELSQERTRFSRLFEALPDPALELDVCDHGVETSRVRTVNPAFEQAFDVDAESVNGDPLAGALAAEADGDTDIVDGDPVERVEQAVRNRRSVSFQLRQSTSDGLRDFVFQAIPYRETEDRVRAFGIYTDITEQRDRERRLEVLNRVLRHNMRTQLNVVDGYAGYLGDQLAGADAENEDDTVSVDVDAHAVTAAQKVRDAAGRVLDLADEARRTLEMIDRDRDEGPVDVAAVARSVVEEYDAEHPPATVDLDVRVTEVDGDAFEAADDTADIRSPQTEREEREVVADVGHDVGLALAQLVENGVVHNHDDPHVAVTVSHERDHVRVTVSDDGPGIPPHERAVIAGETEPTQLEHGSGLGLWIARWVVEGYGGAVDFSETDDDANGTAVTLRLPSV